jgi:hypothetical protein
VADFVGLKVITTALLSLYLYDRPDRDAMAQSFGSFVSNSVDMIDLDVLQEPKRSLAREAVRESALGILRDALNPDRTPPRRHT